MYGKMIADTVRMSAYIRALERCITPGCTVMDLGSGPGIFALLACRMGAGKVYAVEPSDSVTLASELARTNEFGDRIECVQQLSTRITLPHKADVIVADLRGGLPLYDGNVPSIIDARERHLAPGGTLIPRRDSLWVTLVEAPKVFEELTSPWNGAYQGLDLHDARRFVTNSLYDKHVPADGFLTEPQVWGIIDYHSVDDPSLSGTVRARVTRGGTAHGLSMWFDTILTGDIGFSTSPAGPKTVYGYVFFPLPEPVAVEEGDEVEITVRARHTEQDYVWIWNTTIFGGDDERAIRASFKQSTLHGTPLSPERLHKRRDGYTPPLNEEGEIERAILSMVDGSVPLRDIARRIAERYPARFESWERALGRVADSVERYGR
jgi:protein arginine N-methyltransferase 1